MTVWGRTAENCAKYLKKGSQVFVEGRIQTREWEDKDGQKRRTTEIVAQTVQFLSSPGGDKSSGHGGHGGSSSGGTTSGGGSDEVPF